jgi:asparagine synthase (glutamine-hydrolysing)
MCGIAGMIGERDPRLAANCVRAMIDDLARRGPNSEGIEVWNEAVLGHRRLSIFDLSDAGRQPMLAADRATGLVFNGAIYNFLDLRSDLEGRGFTFRSNSDTEVLLAGYTAWGIDDLVRRLHGMYAFALWDENARKLFLVRDRLGVKPLVYAKRNGTIAFASTARALRRADVVEQVDPQAMAEFLEFGYVTDQRTIWQNASKLPAGSILEWSGGESSVRKYWSLPRADEGRFPSFNDAVERTEELLLDAVRMRLQADVPVASLLSGGVDSSLVCWAIAKAGGDITAFTVGTPGDPWDETSDAVATARKLGICHQILPVSGDQPADISELISAYGEPFACASALGMLRVSRAVREHATVLLTGDGGDDVFLGYPEHRHFWMAQRFAAAVPGPLRRMWWPVRKAFIGVSALRRPVHFLDYACGGLGAVTTAGEGFPVYQRNNILGERFAAIRLPHREIPWSTAAGRCLLPDFLEHDLNGRFVGEYMTKVDGGTMYYALEARSPFLDQRLWEFAAALPYDLRLRGGSLKAVLRELARRRIGERVASGRKRGFGIPVQRWIAGPWRATVEALFRDSLLEQEGWIHSRAAMDLMERSARAGSAPKALWYLFVLESWLRQEHSSQKRMRPETTLSVAPVANP